MKRICIKKKTIKHFAFVDNKDYPHIKNIAWYLNKDGYAYRRLYTKKGLRQKHQAMHKLIMQPPPGMDIDHINGKPLDNRRRNLRIVTRMQNEWHRMKINRDNTSGYRGVSFSKYHHKYECRLTFNKQNLFFGYFETKLAAHRAWLKKARVLHGEYLGVSKA